MDRDTFERLLYEGEGATLDFKKEQYPFAKAADEEKSEILKDLIGFANAWRRAAAYILIGVAEKPGERAEVLGIPQVDHLADHSLQQFVNNQTNRPIRFQYEAFGYDGLQVGIIRIDEQQPRPIYLRRDYGKLKKDRVFVRRGSSTDPDKPATPEEIALMGQGNNGQAPELRVEFASPVTGVPIGDTYAISAELWEFSGGRVEIPDYPDSRSQKDPFAFRVPSLSLSDRTPNPHFYRETAQYHSHFVLFKPLRLAIRNTSGISATQARIELTIAGGKKMSVICQNEMPRRPRRETWPIGLDPTYFKAPPRQHAPGDLDIRKLGGTIIVSAEFGDVQPGRQMLTSTVLFGSTESGELDIPGVIYAGNLPDPVHFKLKIDRRITTTTASVQEVKKLADEYDPRR